MKEIILIISLSAFIFCFICVIFLQIKTKSNRNKDKDQDHFQDKNKKKFSFKSLSIKSLSLESKRNKLLILLLIFISLIILLKNVVFSLIVCVLLLYLDWYIKDNNKRKRTNLINKQVVEALIIVKNSLQAGQSLQNALLIAKNELNEPIKLEFKQMADSLSLGVSLDKVLEELSQKTESKEFKLMLDTIRISKDTGASIKDIFDRIIDSTSRRIDVRSKIDALTAQGRMSGNVVSIIPFVVLLVMHVIEPDMVKSLFVTFVGNILLFIAVAMVLIGSFVIRKITEIDF
jgi:tight adherence protein B